MPVHKIAGKRVTQRYGISDPEVIGPVQGRESSIKAFRRLVRAKYDYVTRQQRVELLHHCSTWSAIRAPRKLLPPLTRDIGMYDLSTRVDTRIGTTSNRDSDWNTTQTLKGFLKRSLNSSKPRLSSPTLKIGAVVGKVQSNSNHRSIVAHERGPTKITE